MHVAVACIFRCTGGEVVYEHQSFCLVPFAFSPRGSREKVFIQKTASWRKYGKRPVKQVISPDFRWLSCWYIKNSFLTPLWRSLDRSSQPLTRHSSARRLVRQWKRNPIHQTPKKFQRPRFGGQLFFWFL